MIAPGHLRIIQALHNKGTLTEAANSLNLSQSALSHQIRHLEKKLEVKLWEREGRKLRLTRAGELLLHTAWQVLPVLEQAQNTLKAYAEGRQGVLRIGVECYPCYEWLTGVVGDFMRAMPGVEIDILNRFRFSGLEGLLNHHIDLLVTPDQEKHQGGIVYQSLAEYRLKFFMAKTHRLAGAQWIRPEDLQAETLLSFPVPSERLDVYTRFLNPAGVQPKREKQLESIELMLELISQGRGLALLPEWLSIPAEGVIKSPAGEQGMRKELYIALRRNDGDIAYIRRFIAIGKAAAEQQFSPADSPTR